MKRTLCSVALTGLVFAAQGCGNASTSETTNTESIGKARSAIVGGIADPNHRYVVSLNGCTGTVISKHTVLTAGHCYGSVTTAGFGPKVSGATTIKIASKVRDPLYAAICDQDATYDLTVVKLAEPAPTQAAPLLRMTLDNTPKYIGPSWVWVGYGLTAQGGTSGTKRVTTFPVDLIGPASGRGSLCDIPDTLIYATSNNGRNACNGDSGGPSFFVYGGVEYLAGVTSSGDDACTLDDTQQRSDQPHIDRFIQAQIDANEGTDPCRSNGVCDETCNTNGQVGDPDCAAAHCAADGICSEACVAPRDPDCATADSDNCGDNGICDLKCSSDPDCTRDCAAEGNCIPNCPTPDPDCAGTGDAGTSVPDAGGGPVDAGSRPDAITTPDATMIDVAPPLDVRVVDAPTVDAPSVDVTVRDATSADRTSSPDAVVTTDAGSSDGSTSADAGSATGGSGGAAGGTSTGGSGGSNNGTGGSGAPPGSDDSGCGCRTAGSKAGTSGGVAFVALALTAVRRRRRARRSA